MLGLVGCLLAACLLPVLKSRSGGFSIVTGLVVCGVETTQVKLKLLYCGVKVELKGLSVPSARRDWLPARSTSTSSELSLGLDVDHQC